MHACVLVNYCILMPNYCRCIIQTSIILFKWACIERHKRTTAKQFPIPNEVNALIRMPYHMHICNVITTFVARLWRGLVTCSSFMNQKSQSKCAHCTTTAQPDHVENFSGSFTSISYRNSFIHMQIRTFQLYLLACIYLFIWRVSSFFLGLADLNIKINKRSNIGYGTLAKSTQRCSQSNV